MLGIWKGECPHCHVKLNIPIWPEEVPCELTYCDDGFGAWWRTVPQVRQEQLNDFIQREVEGRLLFNRPRFIPLRLWAKLIKIIMGKVSCQ